MASLSFASNWKYLCHTPMAWTQLYIFSVNEGKGGKRGEFVSSIWYINIKNLGFLRFCMGDKEESYHGLVWKSMDEIRHWKRCYQRQPRAKIESYNTDEFILSPVIFPPPPPLGHTPVVSGRGTYLVEGDWGKGSYKIFVKASLLETGLKCKC